MSRPLRTRFAPAPTGYLHLGHIVNALAVWGIAARRDAAVALRIEDHDRQRCRSEFESALLEDLDWLGLVPALGATGDLRGGPSDWRQSDNDARYRAAVDQLRDAGHHLYVCECSRNTIARNEGRGETTGERPYPGRCRDRGLAPGPDRGLRLGLPPGTISFDDLRLGPQHQEPARQCGDLLLRDRRGNWTYQFAVVVDDIHHAIDLVIRGEDLLDSTGRQLQLFPMLGRSVPPAYLHHTLIRKPNGDKLSKGSGDTSLRDLRASGLTREEILGRALGAAGWSGSAEPRALAEALQLAGSMAGERDGPATGA